MGCPPDPIEKDIYQTSDRIDDLKRKRIQFSREMKDFISTFKELLVILETRLPVDTRSAIAENLQHAEHLLKRDQYEAKGNSASDQSLENLMTLYGDESALSSEVKDLELTLCKGRDLFLKAQAYLTGLFLPNTLKEKLVDQRKLHLEHRYEDVKTKIAVLEFEVRCKECDRDYTKDLGKKTRIDLEIEKVKREIARIKALTDEQLLASRDLF